MDNMDNEQMQKLAKYIAEDLLLYQMQQAS